MATEDNYGDGEAGGGAVDTQNTASVEQDHDESQEHGEEDGGKTAVVPKDLCPDMKVGDEMVVKIVAEHEKDWEVAYAPEKGDKEEKESMSEKAPEEGSMASMY